MGQPGNRYGAGDRGSVADREERELATRATDDLEGHRRVLASADRHQHPPERLRGACAGAVVRRRERRRLPAGKPRTGQRGQPVGVGELPEALRVEGLEQGGHRRRGSAGLTAEERRDRDLEVADPRDPVQQRKQPVQAPAVCVAQLGLDRQVELLDERDLLVERVTERHMPARVELAGDEAKCVKRGGVEQGRDCLASAAISSD
jgi:hypothetical protein